MVKINSPVAVFWFRRDLRLEDNTGLYWALKEGLPVLPLFIFDTDIFSQLHVKCDRRVDFIHQAISGIQHELHLLGSSLVVRIGKPLDVFRQLLNEFDVKAVFANRDYEPYALRRDSEIGAFLQEYSVDFVTHKDQVVFEWNEVLKSTGEPYTVFTPYSKMWKQKLQSVEVKPYSLENLKMRFLKISVEAIPSLEQIGFEKTDVSFVHPNPDEQIIRNYHLARNFPNLEGTTRLSVHLRFGTISIRHLVNLAVELNEEWLNELIWREFFMSILVHFPYVENGAFKKKYNAIGWQNDETEFDCWCRGETGYPIVDAGMRELNETGFMHNRVRMIVASFLTKHLLIDWRWGEAYFAEKLLDYELSSNNGNWQWAAGCGCDAAPYFRIFNPAEQTKRFDPDWKYIRRWVKNIDEPDYPRPIVDHAFARSRALEVYKKSLT